MKDSRGARLELGGAKGLEGQVAVFKVHPVSRTMILQFVSGTGIICKVVS